MTKNVTVIAVNGEKAGVTYPKRARGLVKNGRAVYLDDVSIQLTAQPSVKNERNEEKMNKTDFSGIDVSAAIERLARNSDSALAQALSTMEKADSEEKIRAISDMLAEHQSTAREAIAFYRAILGNAVPKADVDEDTDELEELERLEEADELDEAEEQEIDK